MTEIITFGTVSAVHPLKNKTMEEKDRYAQRGVSSGKEEVESAIMHLYKGLYPTAFCKIVPDFDDETFCAIMHADGVGTKSALAYLYWKETGDLSVWKGIAQDAIAMNINDMACSGAVNNFHLVQIIERDKHIIPEAVIGAIIQATEDIIQQLRKVGINIIYSGGETADAGDVIRTISVNVSIHTRMKREKVILNNIRPNSIIVGLSSSGQAKNEAACNAGMMSNGLTSARHDLFAKKYAAKYPETYSPFTNLDLIYSGTYDIQDSSYDMNLPNLGKMVLSPTRLYIEIIRFLLEEQKIHADISGMIHCTGGGATKVLKKVENMHVIKDTVFNTPSLFKVIQNSSGISMKEMYKTFNMGCGLEIYCDDIETANTIIFWAKNGPGIDAQIIGRTEAYDGRKLTITTPDGEVLTYVG